MENDLKNAVRELRKNYEHDRRKKIHAADLCLKYPEKITIMRECSCIVAKKHNHHVNYDKPFCVEKLCPACHASIHLRKKGNKKESIACLISREQDQDKRLLLLASLMKYTSIESKNEIETLLRSLSAPAVMIAG